MTSTWPCKFGKDGARFLELVWIRNIGLQVLQFSILSLISSGLNDYLGLKDVASSYASSKRLKRCHVKQRWCNLVN